MKLSERMAREDERHSGMGGAEVLVEHIEGWVKEIAHLEEENEALRSYKEEVEQVADVMYQCMLRRLKNATPEDTPISDVPASP